MLILILQVIGIRENLPQAMCSPTVKWILWYLREMIDHSFCYNSASLECIRYIDFDFAGDEDKRRSIIGYVLHG